MDKKLRIIRLVAALYRTQKITIDQKNRLAKTLEKTENGKEETFNDFFKIVTQELDQRDANVREIISLCFELNT